MAACCSHRRHQRNQNHNDDSCFKRHDNDNNGSRRHLLCLSREANKATKTVNLIKESANLISAPTINFAISPFALGTSTGPSRRGTTTTTTTSTRNKWSLVALFVGLLSGAALSGANHEPASEDEDHLNLYLNDKDLLLAAAGDLLSGQQVVQAGHQHQPGHYEFDVAPKMEPPSVRKPPYRQTDQQCPGSDLLGGFSPKDTLCGDLNLGKVPANPIGQSVGEQSYPFELIKNKTLQFLAKALPVLKLEYETIPKVARYLPANQLLNPTSLQSPLGHGHFDGLNQRFGAPAGGSQLRPEVQAPAFVRRRKKRSLATGRQQVSVAEMTPNVSLVVSSAHSAAGKIQSKRAELITRDGPRQLQGSPARPHLEPFNVGSASEHHDDNNNNNNDNHSGHAKQQASQTTARNHANGGQLDFAGDTKSHTAANGQAQARSSSSSSGGERAGSAVQASKQVDSNLSSSLSPSDRRKLDCGQLGNPIVSTVCQTAAALIEGEKAPAWVQAAKLIGNLYSSASPTSSSSSSSSPSTDIWSLLGLLTGSADHQTDAKSSAGAKTASNLWSYLSPFASSFSSSGATSGESGSSLSGREQPANEPKPTTSVAKNKKQDKQAAGSFGQLNVSTLAGMALAGWATTALAGLVQYFVPSAFSSSSSSTSSAGSFSRRKKPFDPTETFVDTPVSLAALAAVQQPTAPLAGSLAGKQPPTPCPSVEEYISPTFARNYQGAWKYVVQIPHEGYFTQTIQRSSCVRSRCEFTEGVCHEAPRWVSLLVAEIYYPNAIFGAPTPTAGGGGTSSAAAAPPSSGNHLATAQSSSHSQQVALGHQQPQQPQQQQPSLRSTNGQDPLQMTDSLNTYNHNQLNSALYNAAAQLGLDPSNMNQMQQLAEAHNYQLLQRNGLLSGSQPAEPRLGHPAASQVKQQQPPPAAPLDANNYEYIKALAIETLRQNPHLSVDDIIRSLQLQTSARKKRDLAGQQQYQQSATYNNNNNNNNNNIHRSSVESSQSLNELAAYPNQIQQQLTAMKATEQVSSLQGQAQPDAQQTSSPPTSRQAQQQQTSTTATNQVECDGHDKIGCYVVRVYYDWFLVNGSCKCWRTSSTGSGNSSGGQQAAGSQQSASGNSFLRRIFTG